MTPPGNGLFPDCARSAAEIYLAKGLAPIPVPLSRKAPVFEDWQTLRVKPEELDGYFRVGVPMNVGILNGEPSKNYHDVDLDCRQALRAAPYLLPATGYIFGRRSTPRSHWIYITEIALNKASETFTDLDGTMLVELRGTGSQTIYPPSVHEGTGERVAWHCFTEPAFVPLRELDAAVRKVAAAALLARHWPGQGSRQEAFLALSGALLMAGWDETGAQAFIGAICAATDDEEAAKRVGCVAQTARKIGGDNHLTGWTRLSKLLGEDGKTIVNRARQWLGLGPKQASTRKRVRTVPPYQPFPVESLPPPIREYVVQVAEALGCDPAFVALPILAVLASAIGNTRVIRLKRGWEEPSVIWSVIVADSGTLKSPAYLKALFYLFRLQKRLLQEYREKLARYKEELREHKAKRREGEDPGPTPEPPVLQRVVVSDVTIEKLAEILEDNARGILVTRDELAAWLASFGRYKGKAGGTDLPNWLEMFRAGTIIVDRKTGERRHSFVERGAASVTGGIHGQGPVQERGPRGRASMHRGSGGLAACADALASQRPHGRRSGS